jgi:hypothetical protein
VTRAQYWTLNFASLAVALLIGAEILMVHQLDHVATMVEKAQGPLAQAQQNGPQVRALVQRTAVGATRDPALKDLLFKYGISFKVKPANDSAAPAGSPGSQASATP